MALTKAQLIDLNANEMIIDLDGDTSITADTDDQIDIKIAGADDFRFTANTFTALSGSTIAAQALTATTIAVSNDGTIGSAGDADSMAISSSGVVTFSQTPVLSGAGLTAGTTPLTTLDIDGATDIGAAVADADLFIIDDGAGGTNRKVTASRVKTYMGAEGGAFSVDNLDIDGSTDIGANLADADLFIVDDGAGGTNRKSAISRIATYIEGKTLTTLTVDDITINGSTISDSGDFTIDGGADIILDADGADVILKDGGTTFASLTNSSGELVIKSGSTPTTALTFSGANVTGAGTLQGTTITATTAFVPDAANGASLGTTSLEFADLYLHDGAQILWGADQDVLLTHVADAGLSLKTSATGDDTKATLTLQTGETDIAVNDVLGAIDFQAPDEGTGTDAILVAAGIAAVSEGDFSSSNNATKLSFKTAASEAAAEKMSLSSAGVLTTSSNIVSGGNVVIADAGNIGSASDTDALAISSGGVVTFSQKPVINSGVAIDNITIDGTEIDLSSGDLTVDVAGDITLDADGADVNVADGGTTFGQFTNSSSDFVINAAVQDKDIIFKGDDGGSAITSLTLDMSNAGAAIFSAAAYNAEATLTDTSSISWNAITQPVAKVTLGGNRTLGAASGGVAGAFISLLIIQDGTGSRTVSFNNAYEFAEDTAPTLTTTASKGDLFVFRYNGSKWLEVGRNLNLTLS
jgi:hypothetical protein